MRIGKAVTGLIVVSIVAVTACGSGGNAGSSSLSTVQGATGTTVDVYSSLPFHGPSNTQTHALVDGIRLALEQAGGKAGRYTVHYTSLDDSTAAAGTWAPRQTAANARKVAIDPKAVYYMGELNSGGSEISIPILNQAGIAMVSPANTYVGLTTRLPGSRRGEPAKYYPTGRRNYLRIVPIDSIQAAADLIAMKQAGCTKVALAHDDEVDGAGLARVLELEKRLYGVTIVSDTAVNSTAPSFRYYARTIRAARADCFFFSGIASRGAVRITEDVNAALPKAKVFGSDGVCTASYTAQSKGGVPADIDPLMECTVATQNLSASPGGRAFQAAYKARYGPAPPDPDAIYGYEAMKLGAVELTAVSLTIVTP
jgi:branched-chain amino acid transport system substrate-binding protein